MCIRDSIVPGVWYTPTPPCDRGRGQTPEASDPIWEDLKDTGPEGTAVRYDVKQQPALFLTVDQRAQHRLEGQMPPGMVVQDSKFLPSLILPYSGGQNINPEGEARTAMGLSEANDQLKGYYTPLHLSLIHI